MAEKIPMLALSPTMEEGTIVKWVKAKGDTVEMNEVLCEVETDKATMEFESPAEGTLLEIFVEEGSAASVGQTVAVLGEEGEDISDIQPDAGQAPSEEKEQESKEEAQPQEASEPEKESEDKQTKTEKKEKAASAGKDKIKSSPLARKLAKEKGIDLSNITGTGPDGRITRDDVEKAAGGKAQKPAPSQAPADYQPQRAQMPPVELPQISDQSVPVSSMRKAIAQRLSESKFTAPHYYLKTSVIMDSLLRARKKLIASTNSKISLNAFLMKFTALALARHPGVNATWQGDTIEQHGSVDVALAVALEDGLITPVVRGCHEKGILVIDAELKTLIEKARTGRLKTEEYANSTFTITNLGSYGVEEFTAIINPPNSAILAVGKISKTPIADDQDHINVHSVMKLTLSCDHRNVDGALGAAFLQDLKDLIEYPINILI